MVNGLAIYSEQGSIYIYKSTFVNIITTGNGGAIYMENSLQSLEQIKLEIINSTFVNISAVEKGGAVYLENVNFTIQESYFINNTATDSRSEGGAFWVYCDFNSIILHFLNLYSYFIE